MDQGAKLVIGQHGGHFGSGLFEQSEEHQIKISDRFYTWGWKNEKHNHVRPLPSPKLASVRNKAISPNIAGPILWVWGADFPKNYYRMYSVPVASQCLDYVYDQVEFGKHVSEEVLKIMKLRPRPTGRFLWEEDQCLRKAGLGEIIEHSQKDFHQRLNESRLCVTTDNSTVFLETLVSNFPTILFWNPDHWELRPKAQPFYDDLRRVNILHNSPKSAAATINKIYKDPSAWWFQPEMQEVRESFCKEFASARSGWLADWKNELIALSPDR